TDADGVTVLYAYDTLGRRDTVALDRNRNGKIDYDGSDRIEKTQLSFARQNPREPTSDIVAQTTKLVWGTAGSDTPETASLSAVAANNLASWLHVGAQTSHRSLSYDGTSWIETTLRPDHSYILRTYVAGTGMTVVDSETLFDKSDTPIVSTSNHYDAHGRLTGSTDTRDGRPGTAFTYYDSDHICTTTTPAPGGPQTTTYTYDDRGRRDLVTLPDSGVIDYDYNTYGKLAEVSGARSYHITYEYDHRGRISKMNTRPGSAHQATTEWHYHPLSGLLAKKIAPGGDPLSGANTHSYQQTPAGRLHKRTNGRATVATFTYLESGELGSITYDDRTTPANAFTYQRSGNLATRSDASGDHIYTPDSQGAYAGSQTIAGPLDKTSITPDYDQLGRRTGLTLTAGNQTIAVSYTYDALSRLDTVLQGPAKATYIPRPDSLKFQGLDFEHDGTHVLSQRIQHDSLNRIASTATTTRTTAPDPLFATTYTYNNGGQRTRATRENGSHWNYHYDAFGHLTDATKFPTSTGSEALGGFAFDYRYDQLGNRISNSTAGLGLPGRGSNDSPLTRYSPAIGDSSQVASVLTPGIISVAGTADPQASVTVAVDSATAQQAARQGAHFHHAADVDNSTSATRVEIAVRAGLPDGSDTVATAHLTPAASATTIYDGDGNITSDGYRTYAWDAENRLVKVETIPSAVPLGAGEYKTEMAYDAIGRRFQKTESHKISGSWTVSSNTRYLYDGWNLIAEIDGTTATPILKRSYMWGTDLSGTEQGAGGTGGLLAVTTHTGPTPGTHATVYDANGNITALVDTSTAEPSATYQYDPYGNLLQATGPAAQINPFRFSTKYHDDTTGLIYYGLRYYDPNHGRWISRDPIGEDGGTNLYSFVGNDPINATDLLGLVLFSFDGTGNDRNKDNWDAEDDENTPTNVAVMTDLYRGQTFYVHGVGTRTDVWLGNLNGYGTKERLETQFRRFCTYNKVKPSDPIDIIGFSRGAASARIFSNKLLNTSRSVLIRFLGIFDTVSQMGVPNRLNHQFGYNLDVSESIGLISHAVAKNEYRSLFPLTSISKSTYYQSLLLAQMLGSGGVNAFDPDEYVEIKGSNFIEKPFTGAHSDIGGGYSDGRNVSALFWMIGQGQGVGAPFADLVTYEFYPEIEQSPESHDSRYFFEFLDHDRVIFPGNR
ncbi:MAG: DUF2235 domain-containing protein, partial [Verrucomicrobiales bacterium]|nr:DUF2235 domain-containing protein [Verrucomicrobiales bacterium]